ncbi:acyl-CoA thioesterase/BAAT N-terminal domain-containing protein [uncultured Sneathia sp.]|uniref:acyl-CoA thioesterase/BAAT N-terminal domain-containing protein n=1 Tax=uncultured Sneathia sp. TaxID=278067 RepID=UPI00259BEBFF|nr:acyl-CoA thioesterase/BAAT N-terminal domain-containing protein [uncultured Sneathia sp.]
MGCKIIIEDNNKMMDSKMNICIQGLKKFEEIKIILETNCFYNINAPMNWSENTFWQSEAIFLSDSNGIVSLKNSPSKGGDYIGIRDMGLFESLKSVSIVNKKHIRDLKNLPLNDVVSYKISVLSDGKLLAKTTFNRFYKNYNINHYDILRDSWQGRLFYEEDKNKKTAIIVLSGSDGGIEKAQNIAMMLSNHGFVTLAISYFGMNNQKSSLDRIPLENIEEALKYIQKLTFVDSAKIGIYGRSKGAEYSLMFLTKYDGIKCAVLNSPSDRVYEGLKGKRNSKHSSWTYGGKEISYKPFKIREFIMNILTKKLSIDDSGVMDIENVTCPLLLITSIKDEIWDSYSASINIMKKAKSYEKSIVLTTELGHMNTISYLPNPRYKKYETDKVYYEAILSWENTISWFINYLKNI